MAEKLKMFFGGILSALGALVLEILVLILTTPLDAPATAPWLMPAGVLIEELFGLFLIGKLVSNYEKKKQAFPVALFFGLGFAIPEILLNLSGYVTFPQTLFLSYLNLLLIHTATAGILGYYFSTGKISYRNSFLFLALAFSSHLLFNLAILFSLDYRLILIFPLIILFICFLAYKRTSSLDSLPI